MKSGIKVGGVFKVRCIGPDGVVKWEDVAENRVVNEGLEHILDILFVGATTQIDPWYVGLSDGAPTTAAADTLAAHSGWAEVDAYADDRKEFVDVRADRSVSNAASKASFAINANGTTVGGAFLASVDSGTSGTLLSVAAFAGGTKTADDGDTLEVQYTFTAADEE